MPACQRNFYVKGDVDKMDIVVGFISLGVLVVFTVWLLCLRDEDSRRVYPAIVIWLFAAITALVTWPGDRLGDIVNWILSNTFDHPMFWVSLALVACYFAFSWHENRSNDKRRESMFPPRDTTNEE